MTYAYATQDMTDKMAKAVSTNARISFKQSLEIARRIKGMYTADALALLRRVQNYTEAIPFTQFNRHLGHRPGGLGPGRYPQRTSAEFIRIIEGVVSNASNKSLDENNLKIHNIVIQKGPKSMRHSRVRGLKAKNTHIEIVVAETARPEKVVKSSKKSSPAAKPAAQNK